MEIVRDQTFLEPPRPTNVVAPEMLKFYETRGWWGQVKKNGTCSVIYVPPKGVKADPWAHTRHRDDPRHKAWQFTEQSMRAFKDVQSKAPNGWTVFVAELLHSKGTGTKDTNYVHDVIMFNGTPMYGKTLAFRQELLGHIFRTMDKKGPTSHVVYDSNTWVAKCIQGRFKAIYSGLTSVEDEGLVLKNPTSVLSVRGNEGWQVKCRKATKNYGM